VIPVKTIQKVLELYLTTSSSYARIAKSCGIPKTSVFNIVKNKRSEDPSFELIRYLVENLDKSGIDVPRYAGSIRISRLLDEHGIDLETGERIIEELLVTCFQEHWPAADAVATLKHFKLCAEEYGMTSWEYSMERFRDREVMKNYKEWIETEKKELKKLKMVRENYDFFSTHQVQLGWIKAEEAKQYKAKYEKLLKDTQGARNEKSIDNAKLKNLNKKLLVPVTVAKFLEKIEDIRQNPAEYWYLFDGDIWAPPMPELADVV
jgi:hypothetical protein